MVDNLTECNTNFITVTVKKGLNPTICTRWHWYKAIVAMDSDPFSKSQILKTIFGEKVCSLCFWDYTNFSVLSRKLENIQYSNAWTHIVPSVSETGFRQGNQ